MALGDKKSISTILFMRISPTHKQMVCWACYSKPMWWATKMLTITTLPDGSAGKEENSLQFLVIKEVIERPQGAFFTIRIRVQIRIVTINK